LGISCTIFSLIIIFSEITLFTNIKFSIFGYLIEKAKNIYITNFIVLLPLIFLFLTTFYGLFNLKLFRNYQIYISKNQKTDAYSILFLSGFICKIGYPLCLNFLQIAKINTYKTSLESFLGVMDLFPVFGNNFAIFYPSLLVIFIIFNIFEIFGKLSQIFGFGFFAGGGLKKVDCEEIIEDGLEVLNRCMCFFLLFYFLLFLLFLLFYFFTFLLFYFFYFFTFLLFYFFTFYFFTFFIISEIEK